MRPELPIYIQQRAAKQQVRRERLRLSATVLLILALVTMAAFVTYVRVP